MQQQSKSKIKLAIVKQRGSYSDCWLEYCRNNNIDYIAVNACDDNIINQVADCDGFLWHYFHYNPVDMNFAKQLLFSLQQAGKIVFPDFNTGWHFDDKLGQKYLFEANGVKSARACVFYSKNEALQWAKNTSYPKVFKLRGGAGSYNVMLVRKYSDAAKLIRQSFGRGFKSYSKIRHFKETLKGYLKGGASFKDLLVAFSLFFIKVPYDKMPVQREYCYFQDFIPNDGYDYRIELCGDKCIAMVRYVRRGDFRASGGHNDHFEKELIPEDVIKFAFNVKKRLNIQAGALDIVRNKDTKELFLVEISYCYGVDKDEFDHGYWDENATWHDEAFNGCDWMIEEVIKEINTNQK